MAAECFCGCGRRLRFGKKRASGHGAEVRRLLHVLKAVEPVVKSRGTPSQQAQHARLLADGHTLDGLFESMAHGLPVAPPPISGVRGWFADATRVARAFQWMVEAPGPAAGRRSCGTTDVTSVLPPLPPPPANADPGAVAEARLLYEAGRRFFEQRPAQGQPSNAEPADPGRG